MERKLTWLIYLIFGINLISCKQNTLVDYKVNLNFVFVNNTKYKVNFNEKASVLNIEPFTNSFYTITTEGGKDLTKKSFLVSPVQPLCNNCIVFFNDSKCDTLKGKGIEDINNFEFAKIKEGTYELKYTFKEYDYLKSKVCK